MNKHTPTKEKLEQALEYTKLEKVRIEEKMHEASLCGDIDKELACDGAIAIQETIRQALKIADKLIQEPSTEVVRKGFHVLEENYDGINGECMGIQGLDRAYKAMVKQLLEEVDDE